MTAMSYADRVRGAQQEQPVRRRRRPRRRTRVENLVTPGIIGARQRRGDARRLRRRRSASWSATRRSRARPTRRRTPATTTRSTPALLDDAAPPDRSLLQRVAAGGVDRGVRRPAQRATFSYDQMIADGERLAGCATCCAARTIRGCSTRRTSATTAAARACSPICSTPRSPSTRRARRFPVVSPTMDDLAERVKARMSLDASGVSATHRAGRAADRARDERGDRAGDRPVHAVRRDLRGPADLVPPARRRPVGHAVARGLQRRGRPAPAAPTGGGRQRRRRRQPGGPAGRAARRPISTLGNGDGGLGLPRPDGGVRLPRVGPARAQRGALGAADRRSRPVAAPCARAGARPR